MKKLQATSSWGVDDSFFGNGFVDFFLLHFGGITAELGFLAAYDTPQVRELKRAWVHAVDYVLMFAKEISRGGSDLNVTMIKDAFSSAFPIDSTVNPLFFYYCAKQFFEQSIFSVFDQLASSSTFCRNASAYQVMGEYSDISVKTWKLFCNNFAQLCQSVSYDVVVNPIFSEDELKQMMRYYLHYCLSSTRREPLSYFLGDLFEFGGRGTNGLKVPYMSQVYSRKLALLSELGVSEDAWNDLSYLGQATILIHSLLEDSSVEDARQLLGELTKTRGFLDHQVAECKRDVANPLYLNEDSLVALKYRHSEYLEGVVEVQKLQLACLKRIQSYAA